MEQYWPSTEGPVADRMNALDKVGFSHTARETAWPNARVATDPVASVGELRRGDGGAAVLMGSANLAGTLSAHGLIDEYRFAVNPVLLGGGHARGSSGKCHASELDLADTRVFGSGIVEMRCVPR